MATPATKSADTEDVYGAEGTLLVRGADGKPVEVRSYAVEYENGVHRPSPPGSQLSRRGDSTSPAQGSDTLEGTAYIPAELSTSPQDSALLAAVRSGDLARAEHLLAMAGAQPTGRSLVEAQAAGDASMVQLLDEYQPHAHAGRGQIAAMPAPQGPSGANGADTATSGASHAAHDAVAFLWRAPGQGKDDEAGHVHVAAQGQPPQVRAPIAAMPVPKPSDVPEGPEWSPADAEGSDGYERYVYDPRTGKEQTVQAVPQQQQGTGAAGQAPPAATKPAVPSPSAVAVQVYGSGTDERLAAAVDVLRLAMPDAVPPGPVDRGSSGAVMSSDVDLSAAPVVSLDAPGAAVARGQPAPGQSQLAHIRSPTEGGPVHGLAGGHGHTAPVHQDERFQLTPTAHGAAPGHGHGHGGLMQSVSDEFSGQPEVFHTPNLAGLLGPGTGTLGQQSLSPLSGGGPVKPPLASPSGGRSSLRSALKSGDAQRVRHLLSLLDYGVSGEDVAYAQEHGAGTEILTMLRDHMGQ